MSEPRFAHYEILERIGQGGMGVVFRARDTRLERLVAIKMLATLIGSSPESRRLLLREARAAASLNHQNIATIYDVGEARVEDPRILEPDNGELGQGPVPYIAMEYVEGQDLRSRLRAGRLPLEKVAHIGVQIARGIEAAHRAKVVHRDLKPANVIVGAHGQVKLLDFGLAKFLPDGVLAHETQVLGDSLVTHEGVILGTVPYMAPEQLEGLHVDERSDLFSLGVVLYEMAAGRPPFSARAPVEYYKALSESHEPLSSARPEATPELSRVVEKLLSRAPEERCRSADEVAAVLQGLVVRADSDFSSEEMKPLPSRRAPASDDTDLRKQSTTRTSAVAMAGGFRRWLRWTAAFTVALAAVLLYFLLRPSPPREPVHLNIHPFANLTGDVNEDDVSLGISKVLAAQLRRIRGLGADIARSTDPPVLRGTVQRQAGRFAVEVELTLPVVDRPPWKKRYEFSSNEILELQVELARDVVRELGLHLTWDERSRLRKMPSRSVQAFEYYLQALSFLENPTSPHLRKAKGRLDRAIELDEDFALAHATLSEVLWETYVRTGANDDELLRDAELAARRADEQDVYFPEAQIALARIYRAGGERARAISLLRETVRQNPNVDEAHRELAITYRYDGQLCDAWINARRAVEIDEGSWRNWFTFAIVSMRLRDHEMAREAFEKAAELAPPAETRPRANLVAAQLNMGDYEGAIDSAETFLQPVTDAAVATNLGTAYFFTDRLVEAERYFTLAVNLTNDPDELSIYRTNLGDVKMRQGQHEEALAEYRRALALVNSTPDRPSDRERLSLTRALLLAKVEECDLASKEAAILRLHLPDSSEKFTTLAKIYALCQEPAEALVDLDSAVDWGARGNVMAQWDELESLVADPDFKRIVAREPRIRDCSSSE